MYVALAEEYEFMKSRTNKVALFSPCSVPDPEQFSYIKKEFVEALSEYNQFVLGGPNWNED